MVDVPPGFDERAVGALPRSSRRGLVKLSVFDVGYAEPATDPYVVTTSSPVNMCGVDYAPASWWFRYQRAWAFAYGMRVELRFGGRVKPWPFGRVAWQVFDPSSGCTSGVVPVSSQGVAEVLWMPNRRGRVFFMAQASVVGGMFEVTRLGLYEDAPVMAFDIQ